MGSASKNSVDTCDISVQNNSWAIQGFGTLITNILVSKPNPNLDQKKYNILKTVIMRYCNIPPIVVGS